MAGRFNEVRGWFEHALAAAWLERAVAEAEKGDVYGRVDHESLGSSLHKVGYCYSCIVKYDDARGGSSAVAAKEKCDVHGPYVSDRPCLTLGPPASTAGIPPARVHRRGRRARRRANGTG